MHRRLAGALLRWLDERSTHGDPILSDEAVAALHSPEDCGDWVLFNLRRLPPDCLPAPFRGADLRDFARAIRWLLMLSFEIEDAIVDQRIQKRAIRRIRPRPPMAPLVPEANLAMKIHLRQLTATLEIPMSRTDIDNLVPGPCEAALMYCAFVETAILGEDTPENLGAAQAILSRMPSRMRLDINLDDYERYRDSLVEHLRATFESRAHTALPVDARD